MAPREDENDDMAEEREQFLKDLAEYHEKRGTVFEPHPKVGPRQIDLLTLYKRVNDEGGYDKVSDTKGNKLAWRRIATEFLPPNAHLVQMAFQIKTLYYKNLAAYEISTIHKKEPPPKEILEDLTAKGGDLLNRTLDNYARRATREVEKLGNGSVDTEDSDNEHGTPKGEKIDLDDPNSTGRVTRGLRAAPPQRVLFGQNSDSMPSRQTRGGAQDSPTPAQLNGVFGNNLSAGIVSAYEPNATQPSLVKTVYTPVNNPAGFQDLVRKQRSSLRRNRYISTIRGMMLPGTGFTGPSIYIRCLRALESGIPSEIKYALHHLVKISFERGDKFLFNQFANLADELMRLVCKVSTVWYQHSGWNYTWKFGEENAPNTLCELLGTSGLVEKIKGYDRLPIDTIHTESFKSTMEMACQACLVLRNMIVLEENARFLAELPLSRDMMTIVFELPRQAETVELKSYALDLAEGLTKYWNLPSNDDFYLSLLETVEQNSTDRGMIITGLRALSRLSLLHEAPNRLDNVPTSLLNFIHHWLLVEDEDLRMGCLDFLYQYTAVTENVNQLVKTMDTETLVDVLMNFLMKGAIQIPLHQTAAHSQQEAEVPPSNAPADTIPKLSPIIIQKICQIADSKEQSSAWLRTCFVADPEGEITQLQLWQAYNDAFSSAPKDTNLMVAKDFITNVTAVFPSASARVVPLDNDRTKSKYTMKGISPRAVPIDLRHRALVPCLWRTPVAQSTEGPPLTNGSEPPIKECDVWFTQTGAEEMWNHILEHHLEIPRDQDNPRKFNDGMAIGSGRKFACLWAGCARYPTPGTTDAFAVCMHIKSHVPDPSPAAAHRARAAIDNLGPIKRRKLDHGYMNTPVDEAGNPTGLPLWAVLVLRNLARQMLKIEASDMRGKQNLVERHFALHQERVFHVMTLNYSLRQYTPELVAFITKGINMAQKVAKPSNGTTE